MSPLEAADCKVFKCALLHIDSLAALATHNDTADHCHRTFQAFLKLCQPGTLFHIRDAGLSTRLESAADLKWPSADVKKGHIILSAS